MNALVLQSDFGLLEGTVAQMYGVSLQVEPHLQIYDLTHNIPKFDTWSASYALYQTIPAWAEGTVFVSVVDPGVGSARKSVVAQTADRKYIVTPNNGSLTHAAARIGITAIREIDERVHRRPGSEHIHVFHGRDVYSYTGAKLAAGLISFLAVGPELALADIDMHPLPAPRMVADRIEGMIEIDDPLFGMVWSNIPRALMESFGMRYGERFVVELRHQEQVRYRQTVPYVRSFADVDPAKDLLYLNEIGNLAIATNLASFIDIHGVSYGHDWQIIIARASP